MPYDRDVADEINAWDLRRDPSHVACLTVNGWSSLFCAAGLDAVHMDTFDTALHCVACEVAGVLPLAGVVKALRATE